MSTFRFADDPSRPQRWVVRDDQPVGALRRGDTTGLALFLIWQVEAGLVSFHLLGNYSC
jgi:hypothetical protein